ncbi:MAG: molecular chaperone DnaJ [Candidatus Sungbacteria bacterium]|uniref:Chaperone protein DnaJ n=1 Tax=Candidatus Sungiibacteriota bacterium TaxID=2750080 RepID=A0A933DRL0_9BACT|nr:molecular chaperone DnaJ [Candidatus Sungbacteria bacterium]MBI4132265.1 molecular chaperone DnaJ [Candidatus Sungbacteria bacterium]
MIRDYYHVLGIPRNASKEDIKKAYRRLAHQYHPDKAGGNEGKFKEINEAYQVLSDDSKRAQYDQFGAVFGDGRGHSQGGFEWPGGLGDDFRGFGDFDFADIFEDVFSGAGFGGGTRERRSRKGRDIQIELEIPFEEIIFGGRHSVEITKTATCERCKGIGAEPGTPMQKCGTCQGRGRVERTQKTFLGTFSQVGVCPACQGRGEVPEEACRECNGRGVLRRPEAIEIFVPKGINDGELLKISGKGEASHYGGVPGDLYAKVRVYSSKVFRRQGNDLIMHLPVKFTAAVLGDSVELKTLDGAIKLKIPEGTESGDILKIRGKGVPLARGYGRGDLLVEIKVSTPRYLSRKAKEVIERLREEGI